VIEDAIQAARLLREDFTLEAEVLHVRTGDFCLGIRSNSKAFLEQLRHYFAHVVTDACQADVMVEAYDSDSIELELKWKDWAREPGKTGRKDAYYELNDGRLLRKVRTGMIFLQSQYAVIARGPCSRLDNQVINFVNSQYMNWLQQRDWLICHASGLEVGGRGVAMAGLSGGGKSTLMLALMDYPDVRYVTNDRLFIKRHEEKVEAVGIPKLPRINPGTIVHNSTLHDLIDPERRATLLELPREALWHLEDKHDVMVSEIYGHDRIAERVQLDVFLVLNWSHDSEQPTSLTEVSLVSRRDLLPAIMKSPGPFYQFADGRFYQDSMQFEEQAYLDALLGVTILEASGRVDIATLEEQLYQWLHHE
jgi:HprK-related kinase B